MPSLGRDSRGRWTRAPRAMVRRPAAPLVARARPAPRRRATRQGIPWKEIALLLLAGWFVGRWLRGVDGQKALADGKKGEGPLRWGTGAPLVLGGLAAAHLSPAMQRVGHLVAGAGALLMGLRFSSRDEKGVAQGVTIAGPDLEALAATTAGEDDDDD